MTTKTLMQFVIARLEEDEEIVVPIKKLWTEWITDHPGFPLEAFTELVLADERVEEMGGVDHTEGMEWMTPEELEEYEQNMESMGYFSGPRAKLKSREISLEHIANMIKKHNDRLEWSLQQAREAMPADVDEQEESALIDIIFEARKLRRKLREIGLEAPPDEENHSE